MPILSIDNQHYKYGAEQVVDPSRSSVGYMGFVAPATNAFGGITSQASMLTYEIPPSPMFDNVDDAESYIFDYIVLNHRRLADKTGFPIGAHVANLQTGQFGVVTQPAGAISMGRVSVDVESVGTVEMPESALVLVPVFT